MITSFKPLKKADINDMLALIESMMEILEALDEGIIPDNHDYTRNHLKTYLKSLVTGQRGSLGRTRAGSWSVVPNDSGMDSDARVDFIFRPTYIATAVLSRALCEYPLIALSIPGYENALLTGMVFCSHRRLQGSGYENDIGAIDALRILALGKIPWLLNQHPEICTPLKTAIDEVAQGMAKSLLGDTAVGAWGEDYSEGFRSAIETIRLKNDVDFMSDLAEAKRNPEVITKDDLLW